MARHIPAVHLEGMGLVGSLLAYRLRILEVPFTWSDTREQFTAWEASTGAVYPTGDWNDQRAEQLWREWLPDMPRVQRHTEHARWCYTSKRPPESGDVDAIAQAGPITISSGFTTQFNVQKIVLGARNYFKQRETDEARRFQTLIVTHGSAMAKHYTWGWSACVTLDIDYQLRRVLDTLRPAVYMRKGYDLAYLYPRPGSDDYYGGTATIVQQKPKQRDLAGVLRAWRAKVAERSGGMVRVFGAARLREGWRPKPYDDQEWAWRGGDGAIYCRPMGGNGVRQFPLLAQAVEDLL